MHFESELLAATYLRVDGEVFISFRAEATNEQLAPSALILVKPPIDAFMSPYEFEIMGHDR